MRIILLGPPGCGKGTQAKLLSKREHLEHIATGDLLRAAIRQQTPMGLRARSYVDAGQLVPDDLVNELVAERFRRDDRPTRFVMDGYPRTLAQAASFDQALRQQFLDLTGVLLLNVSDEELVARLAGRWVCPRPECKATYHVTSHPPRKPGICDDCGSALVQREDDRADTVRARLVVYQKSTAELIPHYRAHCLLREVSGSGDVETVYANAIKALNPPGSAC